MNYFDGKLVLEESWHLGIDFGEVDISQAAFPLAAVYENISDCLGKLLQSSLWGMNKASIEADIQTHRQNQLVVMDRLQGLQALARQIEMVVDLDAPVEGLVTIDFDQV